MNFIKRDKCCNIPTQHYFGKITASRHITWKHSCAARCSNDIFRLFFDQCDTMDSMSRLYCESSKNCIITHQKYLCKYLPNIPLLLW